MTEHTFQTADGQNLFYRTWLPKEPSRAHIAIVHGFCEHGGRYIRVAETLAKHEYAASALDLRGHGNSPGRRAYIDHFDLYVDDLNALVDHMRQTHPNQPIFILGHSMGGLIAVLWAITCNPTVKGLILSGAALDISANVPGWLRAISGWIGRLLPHLPVARAKTSHILSSDPEVIQDRNCDPLVHRGSIPARTGAEMLRAAEQACEMLETVTLPLFIMHGAADTLVSPNGSHALYARAQSTDKTLKIYEGLYHEPLNEPQPHRDQVINDLLAWLDAHTG